MSTRLPASSAVALAALLIAGPRIATAAAEPTIVNGHAITTLVFEGIAAARRAPNGTVFAPVRVRIDGTVDPVDFYGAPMADPEIAQLVRRATATLRLNAPPVWRARHPDGTWAVFWVFQTDGCAASVYPLPERTLPVHVCLAMDGSRLEMARSSVRYGQDDVAVASLVAAPTLLADGQPLQYPSEALRRRREGEFLLAVELERTGAVAAYRVLAAPDEPMLRSAVDRFVQGLRFHVPKRWWNDGERVTTLRIAFGIEGGVRGCALRAVEPRPDNDVSVCADPRRAEKTSPAGIPQG